MPKLGPDFWGQWYRLDKGADDKYGEKNFRAELANLNLQTTLVAGDVTLTPEQLRKNLLKVKEHLRSKGFRVPCASDARVVGVWDLKARACNSSFLQIALVQCDLCPADIKAQYVQNVAHSKSTDQRVGKRAAEQIATQAEDVDPPVKQEAKLPRAQEDLRSFSERKLTADEIRAVDEKLARFCYSEGLPFKALSNAELRGALRKLNGARACTQDASTHACTQDAAQRHIRAHMLHMDMDMSSCV